MNVQIVGHPTFSSLFVYQPRPRFEKGVTLLGCQDWESEPPFLGGLLSAFVSKLQIVTVLGSQKNRNEDVLWKKFM